MSGCLRCGLLVSCLLLGLMVTVRQAARLSRSSAKCGVASISPDLSAAKRLPSHVGGSSSRVIGGTEATPHSWPWQASLRMTNNPHWHLCGASIISERWVMTAAHCCTYIPPTASSYQIVVGSHNRGTTSEALAKRYSLSRVVPHPQYTLQPDITYDFCLLETSEPIKFTSEVSPVCVGDHSDGVVGQTCWATGWGLVFESPDQSQQIPTNLLQQVDLAVVDHSYAWCQLDHTICATKSGKAVCRGDSGGPLVCQDTAGSFQLVGVSSWAPYGCATDDLPSGFARIARIADWMTTVTGGLIL